MVKIVTVGRDGWDVNRPLRFSCARCGCEWREPACEVTLTQRAGALWARTACPCCGLPIEGPAREE